MCFEALPSKINFQLPELYFRLQCSNRGTEFAPSLEETRSIIVACLQQIVLCTNEFPRIEQELLPEMKGRRNLHLLSVGWEEGRVQALLKKVFVS